MSLNLEKASREELVKACLSFQKQTATQTAKIDKLESKVSYLTYALEWFRRQVFGRKSEKLIPQCSKQISFLEVPEESPSETTTIKEYERTSRKHKSELESEDKLRFDESVPVVEKVVLPEEVRNKPADSYEIIGEKVTTRLKQKPASYFVEKTIRKTIKLKDLKTLHTAPAPSAVIDRSYADVSLLTGLIVDKFQYHLPIYRQHQRMKISGVNVSRSNLSNLVHRSLELLEPVYYAILSEIQHSETLFMDETPVKAGRKIKGKMQTAYFWPVSDAKQVCFIYSSSRSHKTVSKAVGKACERLLTDGYSAYSKFLESRQDIVHANCWAHVRRKYFEAEKYHPPECQKVLGIIGELFEIERNLKDKEETEVLQARREQSLLLVDEFFEYINKLWFEDFVDKVSLLGKAVRYSQKLEPGLRAFLEHSDLPLSNNGVENSIRPIALGRKNWLFCWSEVGAKYAAIAYTLIESCKMQNINPWDYIIDILQRIDTHPARNVHELAPKHWKELFGKNASC